MGMDAWLIGAIIGLLALLIAGVMLAMSRRTALAESYYGPLPERDADEAEVTDPTQFGQVTPGAVTPAAAGSAEQFYEHTGVGSEGPRHLSGPPSEAPAGAQRRSAAGWEASTPQHPSDGGWATDENGGSRRLL